MNYTEFNTSLCEIILAGDNSGLQHLHLNNNGSNRHFTVPSEWTRDDAFFSDEVQQIREFINGNRKSFNIRLNPKGTDFQRSVWHQLELIPYGETRSYGEIAAALSKPSAARAVGAANGKNPIPLIIPCHRVIGTGGQLTGYVFGTQLKRRLLELERRNQ